MNRRALRDYCTADMRIRPSFIIRLRIWLRGLL